MRLILFDIDGTLLKCGPQVRVFMRAALEEVFGTAGDLDNYSFSGKTDPGIILDLLTGAGLAESEVLAKLPEVQKSYLPRLDQGLDRKKMYLLPGVNELLDDLAARSDVSLGLLTGNWEQGARIKLSRFDLNRYFPFGAFGDVGVDRRLLPPVALERASQTAEHRFSFEETLIVGDAVADIDCAQAHGVPVVAVATGWTPWDALKAAGADWVVASLEEVRDTVPGL